MTTDYDSDETQTDEAPPMSLGNLPGHAALSPLLKSSQEDAVVFFDSWSPVAVWICTRKRDGAAAEVCRFDGGLEDDGAGGSRSG